MDVGLAIILAVTLLFQLLIAAWRAEAIGRRDCFILSASLSVVALLLSAGPAVLAMVVTDVHQMPTLPSALMHVLLVASMVGAVILLFAALGGRRRMDGQS